MGRISCATAARWPAHTSSPPSPPPLRQNANPAALFAEPPLYLNGRVYVAASPRQFCIYPTAFPAVLLLRRVYTNATWGAGGGGGGGGPQFGPLFWAATAVPPGFEEASALNGVLTVNQTDAVTQMDVAALGNTTALPCAGPGSDTLKCEAVTGGAPAGSSDFEITHFTRPDGTDVVLYRSPRGTLSLQAAVRAAGSTQWIGPNATTIPDDNANINAGRLPDGRTFLLSNAMPNIFRDPLMLTTSSDGVAFSNVTALVSCELPVFTAPDQPWGCIQRYDGGAKQGGVQYPQSLVVLESAGSPWVGYWAIFSLNKEDIWVLRAPFDGLL
jgi:hypothetical protein